MKRYIIDNSALIPLFFDEEGTEFIHDLLLSLESQFCVPDFIAIEFSNVLATGIRRKRITSAEAAAHLHTFKMLDIERLAFPNVHELQDVLDLATRSGLSYYDAIYLSLAEKEGAILVTHDKKLITQAKLEGVVIYRG